MHRLCTLVLLVAFTLVPAHPGMAQASHDVVRYRSAVIDSAGVLRITTARGVEIRPEKVWDQIAFDRPVVSADDTAVAWSALFPNETTSYPITLMVGALWNGHVRAFPGDGLMVVNWSFEQRGREIAIERTTVHGATPHFFELYDVRTGRKLAHYDTLDTKGPPPAWVRRLTADLR